MKRAIVAPATLPPIALAELKQWLGITTAHDDALLGDLLATGLEMCEAFTGIMPLQQLCEEVFTASTHWLDLSTRPVQSITAAESIGANGIRTALAPDAYEFDLTADGGGRVRILQSQGGSRLAIQFTAGLTAEWDDLPDAMRQGIMRIAAHQHRERETSGSAPLPPASVAALWRPWRRMRMA